MPIANIRENFRLLLTPFWADSGLGAKVVRGPRKKGGSMFGLMEISPRLMSIPTVAETLDVSRSTVYRMINDGDLLAVTVRSFKRVSVASVERFIDKRERFARLGEGQ